MNRPRDWPRILVIVGLVALVIGAIDPLEGSLVIFAGIGSVAFGAVRGNRRQRTLLLWSFVLVAAGVGALFGLSALGGVGGTSGRSKWWALAILPYPVGWVMGLVGAVRSLRGGTGRRPPPGPSDDRPGVVSAH